MTILDTFFLLFESDAQDLDKGLDESQKKAKQTTKAIEATDSAAERLGRSLGETVRELAGLAAGYFAIHELIASFFDATKQADKLNEAAQRMGVSIELLSTYGDAIKKNGGSAEGFASSLDGLNRALNQVEVTGKSRAAPFLKALGIDLDSVAFKGKNAAQLLPYLADAFAKLDPAKAQALGSRLGFDQATIMTLAAGRRAVEELIQKEKELGVVTEKQGKIADDFGDQLDDTRHAFRSLWLTVSESVLPALTWVAEKFQNLALFMRKHSDFIVGLMIAIGAAIAYYVVPPLLAAAASALILYLPFILIGAAVVALIVAFALLYDDVMNFIDGGDSLLGRIVEWVKGIEVLRAAVDFLGALFRYVFDSAVFKAFFETAISGAKLLAAALGFVWDSLKAIGGAIHGFVGGGLLQSEDLSQGKQGSITELLRKGQAQLELATTTPLASQTSNSIKNASSNRSTNVQINRVEIKTQATDANGISKSIGDSLHSQLRQTINNYDDGVLG